jgi:hypothetical protein
MTLTEEQIQRVCEALLGYASDYEHTSNDDMMTEFYDLHDIFLTAKTVDIEQEVPTGEE